MKIIALCVFILSVMAIGGGCQSSSASAKRTLPRGPAEDAIYARIGDPDTITGSGRSFLHYDLKNGQTLTIVVSGNEVIGAQVGKKETPNQVPEDTARKLADPQH